MDTPKRNARIAGLLYLLLAISGPVRLIYIPNVLFVRNNAAATSANIAAHESLFRFGIVSDLLTAVLTLFVALALYRLLSEVNRTHAVLMVILGSLMVTPIAFANAVNDGAALMFARGADFLAVFDKPQRDALAMLFIRLHHQGVLANEIFWGLWLIPFGLLVYRSTFLPRALGVWLILNGFGYLAVSLSGLAFPQYQDTVGSIVFPTLLGEVAIMLWLVIKGARAARERPGLCPSDESLAGG
jgi:hypothetical protein